jgi:hypothetical protein
LIYNVLYQKFDEVGACGPGRQGQSKRRRAYPHPSALRLCRTVIPSPLDPVRGQTWRETRICVHEPEPPSKRYALRCRRRLAFAKRCSGPPDRSAKSSLTRPTSHRKAASSSTERYSVTARLDVGSRSSILATPRRRWASATIIPGVDREGLPADALPSPRRARARLRMLPSGPEPSFETAYSAIGVQVK